MPMRDRIAFAVLAVGCLAALAAWHLLGPWPALMLGVLAVFTAGVVYRIEPPKIRFGHWPPEDEPDDELVRRQAHEQDRVGQ